MIRIKRQRYAVPDAQSIARKTAKRAPKFGDALQLAVEKVIADVKSGQFDLGALAEEPWRHREE